jgi:L-2,4-diaminobutyric acid acetyltransferase
MTAPDHSAEPVSFRIPEVSDGMSMWRLAGETGTLDVNSPYSYLLWCRDFAATSVMCRAGDAPVGYITGYHRDSAPGTLFVWQVAVSAAHRGRGIALRALHALIDRVGSQAGNDRPVTHSPVRYLEASITPDNQASTRLFTAFARDRGASIATQSLFTAQDFGDIEHGGVEHEEEVLYRIGPFTR